ncbi:CMP/dCMP-type deaminase domain-containing protein [Lachancea thermotolerans]
MLLYVSETAGSGAWRLVEVLEKKFGFKRCSAEGGSVDLVVEEATARFTENWTLSGELGLEELQKLEKRPFFAHITIDAALKLRVAGFGVEKNAGTGPGTGADATAGIEASVGSQLQALIEHTEQQLERNPSLPLVLGRADIKFYVRTRDKLEFDCLAQELDRHLREINQGRDVRIPYHNTTPLRPDWDTYFMKLATLAASRSNCMKRRVGCVIVRDCRVIATGYNGTPRHLVNCHSGGCPRCNNGDAQLHACLCLHAEENALLEAGRDRVGPNAILYCDTCPCLTCSVKIVQTGIREVVYSQSYRMDEASFKVLQEGGVLVRQFSVLESPRYTVL